MAVSVHSARTSTRDTHRLIFTTGSFLALHEIVMKVGDNSLGVCKICLKLGNALTNVRNNGLGISDIMADVGNNGMCVTDDVMDVSDHGAGVHNVHMYVDYKFGLEAGT